MVLVHLDPATVHRSGGHGMNGSKMNGSEFLGKKQFFVGNKSKKLEKSPKLSFPSYFRAIFGSTLNQIVKMRKIGNQIFER